MLPKMIGAVVGIALGLLAGGASGYWYVAYGARMSNPGYDPSYNYAAVYIILAGAGLGVIVGGLAGFLVGFAFDLRDA